MSEPVTNAQIEDVLSSIRRLVSEDGRSDTHNEQPRQARADASGSAPEKADRLVLTPALRVEEPQEPLEPSGAAPETGPDTGEVTDQTTRGQAADTIKDREPAGEQAAAQESEMSAPWADPSATLFAVSPSEDATSGLADQFEWAAGPARLAVDAGPAEDEAEAPEDALEDTVEETAEDAPEPEETLTFHSARAESLSAKIEELEAVIGRTRDQWEPDGTGGDSYSGTPVRPIGWRSPDEEAAPVPETAADGLRDVPDAAAEAPADELTEELTPEAFDIGDEQAETLPAEDQAAGDLEADASEPDDLDTDDLADDEAVLDEESLRTLVAEIVRQELQGALGERITRNVRKLVRREIHRALAAQDLE